MKRTAKYFFVMGPSWSHGSWIYNYLCNQCLSPQNLWVSNPAHGKMYSIQNYVIKFVCDLQQVDAPVSSTNKTDRHDQTEILLKVALSTITYANPIYMHLISDFKLVHWCPCFYYQITNFLLIFFIVQNLKSKFH